MGFGIFSSIAGANARSVELEVLANNLANIQTSGFKELQVSFTSQVENPEDLTELQRVQAPVRTSNTHLNTAQGSIYNTNNQLDVAIQGDGFFVVQTANGPRYTRSGNFTVNQEGTVTTQSGDPVLSTNGPIKLDPENPQFNISSSGEITLGGESYGKMQVVDFTDRQKLKHEGHGYFSIEGAESLPAKSFSLAQYHLENSNVDLIRTMTRIIEVSRAYESHQKSMSKQVEVSKGLNQVAKLG